METPGEREFGKVLLEMENAIFKLSEALAALRRLHAVNEPEEYRRFLKALSDCGLGVHELNILNNCFDSRSKVLSSTTVDLSRCKQCGPISIGKIRAALEVAGFSHALVSSWDGSGKCEKAYRKWLAILQLAQQQHVSIPQAEYWITLDAEKHAPI